MGKSATRAAYGEALKSLGKTREFFVMDADLSGSTQTAVFAKEFPSRFINCGIAEANMVSVAAGISTCGYPVFVSSFAMFASGRAFEQIRNSVGYPHLNVKIAASHAGITVGEDGATHQCIEDLALMRSIPGMTVINPADATETHAAVEAALNINGPVYLRLGRYAVPDIFAPDEYKFQLCKAVPLREGTDAVIFATGLAVSESLAACDLLKDRGISVSVVNVHTIKPIDRETILTYASRTGNVITVEEHSIIGGLGSAVEEVLSEECPTRLCRIGINDTFGKSGKASALISFFGLDSESIARRTAEFLNK